MTPTIILASNSPRRRDLLRDLGFEVKVFPPKVDETPLPDEKPDDLVKRLATLKGKAVAAPEGVPVPIVVAADTVVVAPGGQILGKPADDADALEMLSGLQGKSHEVWTGYYCRFGQQEASGAVLSVVSFRGLTKDQIQAYVATGEGRDKAGSYAAQGIGQFMIVGIQGSYSNVVGLPVAHVVAQIELFLDKRFPALLVPKV